MHTCHPSLLVFSVNTFKFSQRRSSVSKHVLLYSQDWCSYRIPELKRLRIKVFHIALLYMFHVYTFVLQLFLSNCDIYFGKF
mgnify:CR=1 FL=1